MIERTFARTEIQLSGLVSLCTVYNADDAKWDWTDWLFAIEINIRKRIKKLLRAHVEIY